MKNLESLIGKKVIGYYNSGKERFEKDYAEYIFFENKIIIGFYSDENWQIYMPPMIQVRKSSFTQDMDFVKRVFEIEGDETPSKNQELVTLDIIKKRYTKLKENENKINVYLKTRIQDYEKIINFYDEQDPNSEVRRKRRIEYLKSLAEGKNADPEYDKQVWAELQESLKKS